MKSHPAAELFPMLVDDDLVALKNDILATTQRYPIIVWNDQIIDGRNRWRACEMLGIKPKIKEMHFDNEHDVVSYIISTNIRRRHLTESQRAMISTKLASLPAHRPTEGSAQTCALTQSEAADQMQVSRRSVQTAREVEEKAPDLVAKVMSGELKVSKAAQIARERVKAPAVTDYANASDSVIDKKEEANATGYTPKMEKVWSSYSALDAVEQTAFRERMNA